MAFLLLGAHFLREGAWVLTAACAALALAVAWRRPWVSRLLQAALVLGTIEWAWTAFILVQQRMAEGRPWERMAVILGVVTLLTAGSIVAVSAAARARCRTTVKAQALEPGKSSETATETSGMARGPTRSSPDAMTLVR